MRLAHFLLPLALLLAACVPAVVPAIRTTGVQSGVDLYGGSMQVRLHTGRRVQTLPAYWNEAVLTVESAQLKAPQTQQINTGSNVVDALFFVPPGEATVSASLRVSGELVATGSATASIVPGPPDQVNGKNVVSISLTLAVSTIGTFAGQTATGSVDATGTDASFNYPSDMAIDASGSLYVADELNHRIRFVTSTGVVTTLAGSTMGFSDGSATDARFNRPVGVAYAASGSILYVAERDNHLIRMISLLTDPSTPSYVMTTAGSPSVSGNLDGYGSDARFNAPTGLAYYPTSNYLFVADAGNHAVRRIDLSNSAQVLTLAGSGTAGTTDATGNLAQFNTPRGVAVDSWGYVYVADTLNNKIRRVAPDGTVTTVAGGGESSGSPSNAWGQDDGTGGTSGTARFYEPEGILWLDNNGASGSLVISDTQNHRLREIDLALAPTDTGFVKTLVGVGPGFADGTAWTATSSGSARFDQPKAVVPGPLDRFIILDYANHRIRFGVGAP